MAQVGFRCLVSPMASVGASDAAGAGSGCPRGGGRVMPPQASSHGWWSGWDAGTQQRSELR